jgi:hypothetical protein
MRYVEGGFLSSRSIGFVDDDAGFPIANPLTSFAHRPNHAFGLALDRKFFLSGMSGSVCKSFI